MCAEQLPEVEWKPAPEVKGKRRQGYAQNLHLWLGARENDHCEVRCFEDVEEKRKVVERLNL